MSGDPPSPLFRRVAILGVGLIGGSVAASLRARALAGALVGYTPGDDARRALALGLVDMATGSAAEAVVGADLVVLAAPIPALPGLLREVRSGLAPDAVVTDCASTKGSVIAAAQAALGTAFERFVPGHPIAGAEHHGPAAARAGLFENALVVLCPQPQTSAPALGRVRALWDGLGARTVSMEAATHDDLFAEVSHWPHAVAFALCAAIAGGSHAEAAARFAGAGLRDTTRIGASSPALWADILLDNRAAVLRCAERFERELGTVLTALRDADRDTLVERFEAASRWRRTLRS